MHIRVTMLTLALLGCASPSREGEPWHYRSVNLSGYRRIQIEAAADLVTAAERNYRESPALGSNNSVEISAVRAGRRPDGRTVIVLDVGLSDTSIIYIFGPHGQIIDRYLHSFWGE